MDAEEIIRWRGAFNKAMANLTKNIENPEGTIDKSLWYDAAYVVRLWKKCGTHYGW